MPLKSAPYHASVADEPIAQAYWVRTDDNLRIRVAHWAVPESKGTVILFPGRTEYIEKYAVTAGDFQAQGFGTFAIDWRGQGLADRLIANPRAGYVENFSDYQIDVQAALAAAEQLDLPKPWHLLGHSMGGAIGIEALQSGVAVNSAAFSGPMWGIGASPLLRLVANVVSSLAVAFGQGERHAPGGRDEAYVLNDPFEGNVLTRDETMYERMRIQARANPELNIGGFSLHWLRQALIGCHALQNRSMPDMPCLTIVGANERVVRTETIKSLVAKWPGAKLLEIENGEHETLMEGLQVRQPIIDAIAAHYSAHS